MSSHIFIKSFTKVPKELFRMTTGGPIRRKAHPSPDRPQRKFDILASAGKVQPKALDPDSYGWPNGASIRPNGAGQQRIVHSYTGPSVSIYSIPEGIPLPSDLLIVHEFGDHYSLQPRREMTVEALETKINDFLHARKMPPAQQGGMASQVFSGS